MNPPAWVSLCAISLFHTTSEERTVIAPLLVV